MRVEVTAVELEHDVSQTFTLRLPDETGAHAGAHGK
jgi:hypothetical protein